MSWHPSLHTFLDTHACSVFRCPYVHAEVTPVTPTTTLTKTKPELHVLIARESSSRLDVVGRNLAMMKGSESHVPATRMRSIREHASPFGATQLRNMATNMTDSSRCRHLQGQRGCCYTYPLMFLCLFLAVLTSFKRQSLSFSWGITHVLSLSLCLALSLSLSLALSLSLSLSAVPSSRVARNVHEIANWGTLYSQNVWLLLSRLS